MRKPFAQLGVGNVGRIRVPRDRISGIPIDVPISTYEAKIEKGSGGRDSELCESAHFVGGGAGGDEYTERVERGGKGWRSRRDERMIDKLESGECRLEVFDVLKLVKEGAGVTTSRRSR